MQHLTTSWIPMWNKSERILPSSSEIIQGSEMRCDTNTYILISYITGGRSLSILSALYRNDDDVIFRRRVIQRDRAWFIIDWKWYKTDYFLHFITHSSIFINNNNKTRRSRSSMRKREFRSQGDRNRILRVISLSPFLCSTVHPVHRQIMCLPLLCFDQ